MTALPDRMPAASAISRTVASTVIARLPAGE